MAIQLSVIIPCRNGAATLDQQLEALAAQTWEHSWEIILADNGSTDETSAIVKRYQQNILPNLRFVDASQKPGAGYARNQGVLAARSDKIAFCDADDVVAPGWVAALGEALSCYKFVACRQEYEKLNPPWAQHYRSLIQQEGLQAYTYPPFLPHASGSTLAVRRSVHLQVGGFDETLLRLEDTDYCWRLQLAGVPLHFVPEALIHYRFRDSFSGLYSQAHSWGKYNVLLYKRYRSQGMPSLSFVTGLKAWAKLGLRLPLLLGGKAGRAGWLWQLAWRVGRLQGSWEYGVLAL